MDKMDRSSIDSFYTNKIRV